jgi:mannosyltransferase OCH1-like enzyme
MKSNAVPAKMKEWTDTWIKLNPEYHYNFVDDNGINQFIRSSFPDYFQALARLKHGASKADLWRYLVMFKHGGVYADVDCFCVNPLKETCNFKRNVKHDYGNKDYLEGLKQLHTPHY